MPQVFDIVFAGGGTTACVVAGRLMSGCPSLKILVIESGQHSRDIPSHVQPCRYIDHLAKDSTTLSYYVGKPSTHLNGRNLVTSCGQSVGGGSAVNFMLYTRCAASDYDDWAVLGNKGWSFDELLPFIKKHETFTANVFHGPTTHGDSGPVKISTACADIGNQFLNVARQYDLDRAHVDDNNDFVIANAYSPAFQGVFFQYVDPVTGRRSDTASGYLYPHAGNPNLTVMVGKHVQRIIIESGRAAGVEYTSDNSSNSELVTVKASKLVVISAGAFSSPAILERSGIGGRSVLETNKIYVQVNLPGVGENYRNHLIAHPVFYASDETETMDDVWDDPGASNAQLEQWKEHGTGKIGRNGYEAVFKLRPTEAQLSSGGSALQRRWETFFEHAPDKSMGIIVPCAGLPFRQFAQSLNRKVFSVVNCILYPEVSGSTHITSGDVLGSAPDFDPKCLTSDSDIAQLTLLYKVTRELIRRMPAYRGEVAAFHPKFPPGSPAGCKETDVPVPIDTPDIVYSDADNEAIKEFLRDSVMFMSHSLGTCAMKPRDQGGVVDARLNVYGVEGLKVADLSICPTNVGSTTYPTALTIGEKAAAIIAEDLGLKTHGSE